MARRKRGHRVLKLLAGLVLVLVIAALLVTWLVDLDAYKPRIEAMASAASGMEVRFEGALDLRLVPRLMVRANEPRVVNRDTQLFSAESVSVGLEWRSLIAGRIQPSGVRVHGAHLHVVRDEAGRFNFDVPGAVERERPAVAVFDLRATELSLLFDDRMTGLHLEVEGCDASVDHLVLAEGAPPESVTMAVALDCRRVELPEAEITGLSGMLYASDGVFRLDPLHASLFGGEASGFAGADFSGPEPRFEVDYRLAGFRMEAFLERLAPDSRASGQLDLLARVTTSGLDVDAWRRNASGDVALEGRDIDLIGIDIDDQLARYESSQNFNLVDAGAFFFAGPLGVAVTKGHDFSRVLLGSGGRTRIEHMTSEWSLRGGVAEAQDVALATSRHRLAMQGRLDFVGERFDGLVVAVLDGEGCATVKQTIRGPFSNPRVDTPDFLRSITGPVRRLFGRARELLPGRADDEPGQCEVFYTGAVAAPVVEGG